jgi:S-adenosylmethionine:tRNA ribosyltransferase-isomerase
MYRLKDFDFILPERLIAQEPAHPRDHARLLIYDRTDRSLADDYFYNLPNYLPAQTTLVLNNSKVEKCRLRFGATEIFVLESLNDRTVRALVKPGKKFQLDDNVELTQNITARVTAISDDGLRTIVFNVILDDSVFDPYRLTPLPPYIAQNETLSDEYQTVYAKPLGSKAAPTAGLHFTPELLDKIRASHDVAETTLHVGLGTFAPVKASISEHKMHEEWFEISHLAADTLNRANHITAVGTTSVRTLESADYPYHLQTNATDIFITPGYNYRHVDALITNFHLPKSTLLMLVSAFLGSVDELHRIYQHAIGQNYRFYSFGDAMLIL